MTLKIQWNQLTPLSQNNAAYEPEMQQIIGYAEFIGLQLPEDNKYLYLARQGLKTPLPPFWEACEGEDGELYFRNKKTRMITMDNPLDQIYIQRVKQLRQLQAHTHIYSINEESALNESSGMYRSRQRTSDLRKSDRLNNNSATLANRILERHITEESVEFENASAEKISPRKSELLEITEPQWKIQQKLEILELKGRIENMVFHKKDLITNIQTGIEDRSQLENIMDLRNLSSLIDMRLKVEEKRAKLELHQRERRQLQITLDQLRQKAPKKY